VVAVSLGGIKTRTDPNAQGGGAGHG
jgi:hypothetical protein